MANVQMYEAEIVREYKGFALLRLDHTDGHNSSKAFHLLAPGGDMFPIFGTYPNGESAKVEYPIGEEVYRANCPDHLLTLVGDASDPMGGLRRAFVVLSKEAGEARGGRRDGLLRARCAVDALIQEHKNTNGEV